MYRKFFKRILDVSVGLAAFLILMPVFGVLTLLLWFANKGSPFYTQLRPGKGCKLFRVIKFKTMNDAKDDSGKLLPDEVRLTRIGKVVRKTSLDEIPQLLNVIKGDMSLIGPRPLLIEYVAIYSAHQRRRHEVRPGITGWAQINGRNTISWREKFELDVWYVDNLNFLLDANIAMMTLVKVFKAEGISGRGVATAERFNGSN